MLLNVVGIMRLSAEVSYDVPKLNMVDNGPRLFACFTASHECAFLARVSIMIIGGRALLLILDLAALWVQYGPDVQFTPNE